MKCHGSISFTIQFSSRFYTGKESNYGKSKRHRITPLGAFIRLNLPGTADYNPTLPWILKIRKDGFVASDIAQYVDDVRIMAPSEELAWLCSSKMAKELAFLGLQDAARKRRMLSQTHGTWAGATVSSDGTVL